jgi:excisionase family DNA binding protein
MMSRATMTAKEAAGYLGCSYDMFLKLVRAKKIPFFRAGSRVLCRKESLDLWMAEQETASMISAEPDGLRYLPKQEIKSAIEMSPKKSIKVGF